MYIALEAGVYELYWMISVKALGSLITYTILYCTTFFLIITPVDYNLE